MAQTKFSVSWDAYQKNICNGLSALQQRGEFVDMTLAADGHHVKVHKMVMSLVSPYIKELISSADCAHPVIFLNQISFKTLCAILEYIYTGEVLVEKENLNSFVLAGKALHIKGLKDMSVQHTMSVTNPTSQQNTKDMSVKDEKDLIKVAPINVNKDQNMHEVYINEDISNMDEVMDNTYDDSMEQNDYCIDNKIQESTPESMSQTPTIQYTISNQGNLQMVLNRYMYYLTYTGRTSGHRRWQCIDNHTRRHKCPASVITKNDLIVQRIAAHNHPFHDQKILKKVQAGSIFSALQQAELQGKMMQKDRTERTPSTSLDMNDSDANKI